MLLQLLEFIQREQVVSTQQLSREFQVDNQALQPMLDIWVRKKVIGICEEKAGCQSSCFRCKTNLPIFYQYLDHLNRA